MNLFIATWGDSTGAVDITANGSTISMVDHSNYQNYSDTATAGGATSITLASDASSITDFYKDCQIEILSGTSVGEKNTITAYNGTTKVATVSAWVTPPDNTSVYEISEGGHLQSNFSDFKKINILLPDATNYLYSTLGDGDTIISTPDSETLPITQSYSYTTGDGVYTVTLYVLPTYDATAYYFIKTAPYVYYGGKFYKLLQDANNKTPDTETDYWEEVTLTTLSSKYLKVAKFAVTCDSERSYAGLVDAAVDEMDCMVCTSGKLCSISEWVDAVEMFLILESIPSLVSGGYWNKVTNNINKAKAITSCN